VHRRSDELPRALQQLRAISDWLFAALAALLAAIFLCGEPADARVWDTTGPWREFVDSSKMVTKRGALAVIDVASPATRSIIVPQEIHPLARETMLTCGSSNA
jgi:hypothetical protein